MIFRTDWMFAPLRQAGTAYQAVLDGVELRDRLPEASQEPIDNWSNNAPLLLHTNRTFERSLVALMRRESKHVAHNAGQVLAAVTGYVPRVNGGGKDPLVLNLVSKQADYWEQIDALEPLEARREAVRRLVAAIPRTGHVEFVFGATARNCSAQDWPEWGPLHSDGDPRRWCLDELSWQDAPQDMTAEDVWARWQQHMEEERRRGKRGIESFLYASLMKLLLPREDDRCRSSDFTLWQQLRSRVR